MSIDNGSSRRWYDGITRYQWLVLLIASLGWIFDVFEGQIFVASMNEAMPSLLPENTTEGAISLYNNFALGSFLIGGAVGGILFGMLSDRIGRTRTMIYTILMYSCFTCVTAFAQSWWHMVALRFLVAMGVGGEWAVASAMVAEVFPKRARAWSLGIFHASSVFGTYFALLAGAFIVGNQSLGAMGWRLGFAIGALPAVLTLWIRWKLREPEQWIQARQLAKTDSTKQAGRLVDLFAPALLRNTLVGVSLATIGLATFWGAHIYGKDLLRRWAERDYLALAKPELDQTQTPLQETLANVTSEPIGVEQLAQVLESADAQARLVLDGLLEREIDPADRDTVRQTVENWIARSTERQLDSYRRQLENPDNADPMERKKLSEIASNKVDDTVLKVFGGPIKRWEMFGLLLVTTGGGLGLVSFGPLCEIVGRRMTFLLLHVGGLASALVLFQVLATSTPQVYYVALPIFGFLTLGMHAGYAIYFPELFPTRLRGTGGGFCFNGGRILAAPILVITGFMRKDLGLTLENMVSILSLLFVVGAIVSLLGPETKGQELPE